MLMPVTIIIAAVVSAFAGGLQNPEDGPRFDDGRGDSEHGAPGKQLHPV